MPRRSARTWARHLRDALVPRRPAPSADLEQLASTWDTLGANDPLWAVLTRPGTREGRWDIEEFFRTGEQQVAEALAFVGDVIGWPVRSGTALDFGCGVGRLAQALCGWFEVVHGVDIAPSMIEAAERFNRFGDRCRYHLNVRDDLSIFPDASFDFVYSTFVLQHMPPVFASSYVREFVRLLSPDGIALFQIPTATHASGQNEPMPDAWFVGELELEDALPSRLAAGQRPTIHVHVTNRSPGVWRVRGTAPVRVAGRWRDGRSAAGAEARGNLPGDLEPGDHATVELEIPVPRRTGRYLFECGLIQEGVAWFVDRGGVCVTSEVEVVAPDPRTPVQAAPSIEDLPNMEMFVTPADEVVRWVSSAGGQVMGTVDSAPDDNYDGLLFAVAGAEAARTRG